MTNTPFIEMQDISKSFSGNQVLKNVNFTINKGEIHALVGENGAGKSTLIKILTGIHKRNSGSIKLNGEMVDFSHPREAEKQGIMVIHQELNIIPHLTVTENMFLGKSISYGKTGVLNAKEMKRQCKANLQNLGVSTINPDDIAGDLSVGKQQMIEIARAVSTNAELIVMDEPTAALTDREIKNLFEVVNSLQKQGVAIIYISHRMEEIFKICDRITVLRDGEFIGTEDVDAIDFEKVVRMMVGRDLGERFPERDISTGNIIFKVNHLARKGFFNDISFSVKEGEVLGVAGLMGAGRSEIMETIFGYASKQHGSIQLNGKELTVNHPLDAIKAGIGFITEDRKSKGLITDFSIRDNISLTNMKTISSKGVISSKKEHQLVADLMDQLKVKATGAGMETKALSGGNQQKVVIAKWLGIQPKLLILDEPTRGVDVGAKKEIYSIMNKLTEQGVSIIMVSSELPEVLGVSDRIMVIHEGNVAKIFNRDEADQEKIMTAAAGGE